MGWAGRDVDVRRTSTLFEVPALRSSLLRLAHAAPDYKVSAINFCTRCQRYLL